MVEAGAQAERSFPSRRRAIVPVGKCLAQFSLKLLDVIRDRELGLIRQPNDVRRRKLLHVRAFN